MARQMDRPVETFSVGFTGGDSELPEARKIAAELGAEHHELEIDMQTTPDDLRRLVWHLDEPLADLSSVGFLALCELASRHVTVALTGQGADELFGGYRKHRVASLAETWRRVPAPARALGARVGSRGPGRAGRLFEALQAPDPVSRLLGSSSLLTNDLKKGLFDGALAEQHDAARGLFDRHMQGAPGAAPLEAALYLDAKLGLVDDMLTYFDRCSMACSLEVRVPFLDHEFVELAARIPTEHKVHRLQGKHVLRLAAKGLVPDDVLTRKKRGFFNEAVGPWLADDDGAVVREILLAPEPALARVLDMDAVHAAVADWRAGDSSLAPLLLALIMLELWLGEYLPRAFAKAPPATIRGAA